MISLVTAFLLSVALSLLLTFAVRALARRWQILDIPDGRRHLHIDPVPRLGGVGIYFTSILVFGFTALLSTFGDGLALDTAPGAVALLVGASAIFLLGLSDDLMGLGPKTKLTAEILVASAVYFGGVQIRALGFGGSEVVMLSGAVGYLLTVLWLVGISNAFNLIDGSDGLAGGAALIALGTFAIVSIVTQDFFAAMLAMVLAGAVLGFLFFNFPPASIFLGDSGSLFIGFSLAGLGIITTQKTFAAVAVAVPLIALGLPILDTLLAVVRRALKREPLFSPDRGHIHHRLRDLGHSPRRIILVLYGLCVIFALMSMFAVGGSSTTAAVVLVLAAVVMIVVVQRLRVPELVEFGRVIQRGTQHREVIARSVRIRNAITALEMGGDEDDLWKALRWAIEGSEYDGVSLSYAGPQVSIVYSTADDLTPRRSDSVVKLNPARPWILVFPIRGGPTTNRSELRLSCSDPSRVRTVDITLVSESLVPCLERRLREICGRREGKRVADVVGSLGAPDEALAR